VEVAVVAGVLVVQVVAMIAVTVYGRLLCG